MKLRALLTELRNEYQAWDEIAEHGCGDPARSLLGSSARST